MSTVPPVFRSACKRAFGTDAVVVTPAKRQRVEEIDVGVSLSCDELLERLWALTEAGVHIRAILFMLQDDSGDYRRVATSHLGVSDTLNRRFLRESVGADAFSVLESTYLKLTSMVVDRTEVTPKAQRVRIQSIRHDLGVFVHVVDQKTSAIKSRLGPALQERRPRTHYESMYA
jgi:hypothetical protein